MYSYKCCIGGCEETQACPSEEVLTSLFIIFLQCTFLAISHSIRLTNIRLANIGLANIGLANIRLANIGLANIRLANTGLSAVAWERTPIPGADPYFWSEPLFPGEPLLHIQTGYHRIHSLDGSSILVSSSQMAGSSSFDSGLELLTAVRPRQLKNNQKTSAKR